VPPDELTPRPATSRLGTDALDLLRAGRVEVLGRMPWGSNATLLATVSPPCDGRTDGEDSRTDGQDGQHSQGSGAAPSRHAVYNPRRGERPLWDFPPGLDKREVAAYELSEALGWGIVPETVLRDDLPFGVGSLQRFVPFDTEAHYFTLYEDRAHHDALRTIACFDLLCNQTDRKSGHCLLGEDGHIWAVDNALAFHPDDKLRTVIWEFAGEAIPDALRADVGRFVEQGLPASLERLLDPDECDALVSRARAVVEQGRFPTDTSGHRYPWPLV
jgi:uncharacterized repeat protein (TIGR03843 family)